MALLRHFLPLLLFLPALCEAAGEEQKARPPFLENTIGPEKLLPLNRRGLIRLHWKPYELRSRFDLKLFEQPLYRILIAPEGMPASEGRVHATYDTSYPFTNLEADARYNIRVEVEQTGVVVLEEALHRAVPITGMVRWFAAPASEGGSPSNPGTWDRPKDAGSVCAGAGPGDLIVFKSGIYGGPGAPERSLRPEQSGRPGARILFLAESNDVASGRYVSFHSAWGNIYVNRSNYVLFDGINCDSDQGQNSKALASFFGEQGRPTGVIVRNIYFRAITSDKHLMVNGCREFLIENCFFAGSLESHNVYLCNNTQDRPDFADSRGIFRNCVSINSTLNNLHANGFFDNFLIENNLFAGAKVANISLATVHRNALVRNNIAFGGAKQAITLNFYHTTEMENRFPCSNIQICHNTLVVPETTEYLFPAVLLSDKRRLPHRHVIRGLKIKNNILVNLKPGPGSALIELWEGRHMKQLEAAGNAWYAADDGRGHGGEVLLPSRGSQDRGLFPFAELEELFRTGKPLRCLDVMRDAQDAQQFEEIEVALKEWRNNLPAQGMEALFLNPNTHTFVPRPGSTAYQAGVKDEDTRRVIRDFYGHIRDFEPGRICSGAIASPPKEGAAPLLGEYVLRMAPEPPAQVIVEGRASPALSALLEVRAPYPTLLRDLGVTFEMEKSDKQSVIDVPRDVQAEVVVNGRTHKLVFYKQDQAGNEKIWLTGWAHNLNEPTADGQVVSVKALLSLNRPGQIKRVCSGLAHDNIWGFDSRGWKAALTGMNEIGVWQKVLPAP